MTFPANEILLLNPRRKRPKKPSTKRRAKKRKTTRTTTTRTTTTRTNPRRQRRRVATKGHVTTMAKKSTKKRKAPRRNPSRRRRAVASKVRSSVAGLNFKTAIKNVPLGVIGMFVTKWAAKRGTPDALESDPSTWGGMTYLKGGLGAVGGAWAANMIKPGSGQKVLEGGLLFLAYKAAQNHIVPKNSFLTEQFGGPSYKPGDVETNSAGEPFILGQDGQTWIPLGEDQTWEMMGQDALEVPGRLGLGDVIEPAGRLGFGQTQTMSAYGRNLFER